MPAANNRVGTQQIGDDTWTYTYDDEGNVTQKSKGASAETWVYEYDHRNQLTHVERRPSATGTSNLEADYKYDVFGNRLQKSVDADGDEGGGGATITRFALDGWKVGPQRSFLGNENWDIWADLDSGNNLLTRYMRGDVIDELFARISAAEQPSNVNWLLTDRLGSVRDVTNSGGAVTDSVNYDGFGNVIGAPPAGLGRYQWTGRERDAETNFYYNRARYYDPLTGRWISRDPLGFDAGDSNLYRYVNNGPTNGTDPSGLWDWKPLFAEIEKLGGQKYVDWYRARGGSMYPTRDFGYRVVWDGTTPNISINKSYSNEHAAKMFKELFEQYDKSGDGARDVYQKSVADARNVLALAAGLELGSKNPNADSSSVIKVAYPGLRTVDEVKAFVRGFLVGQIEGSKPGEWDSRLKFAEELEKEVTRIENHRRRPWYHPWSWLGDQYDAPDDYELRLRRQINDLRSPWMRRNGQGTMREVEGVRNYAVYGSEMAPEPGVRSPDLVDDPIFWLATFGTGGMTGQLFRVGSIGTLKQVGITALKGARLGIAVNSVDQLIRMAEGHHQFDIAELGQAAVIGAVAFPLARALPGMVVPSAIVFGAVSVQNALSEGMPITAAFRATLALFGPKIFQQLMRAVPQFQWNGPRIQSGTGQTRLRDMGVVNQIRNDMLNWRYRFTALEGRIGGYRDAAGNYYIGEGHHRMNAALQIFEQTGNATYVNQLLQNGRWELGSPPASQIRPLPRR